MFDVRHFLRQISAEMLLAFFEFKVATVPPDWRKLSSKNLAKRLADRVMSGEDPADAAVLEDLIRLHPMASERGKTALLNAASNDSNILQKFGELANDHERAMWMLMTQKDFFREGEGLRFFDYYAEGSKGRHYRTYPNIEVRRTESAVAAFRNEVCQSYRRRDGSGASCHVEFVDRRAEGTTQVTVYVEGLPNHATELVNGDFKRLVAHPTIDAAIVYDPRDGHTTTVAKGGALVHEMLREAFALKLLGIEPKFDVVVRRRFQLESLKTARSFEADPAHGIKAVRVRKLSLAPPNYGSGRLTIEAPASEHNTGVHDVGNRWFVERSRLFEKFNVVHVTICIHFHPQPEAKRMRTINLELSSNTSNLNSLKEADRKIAEACIDKWQLVEQSQ
jgi:hypothetical protein